MRPVWMKGADKKRLIQDVFDRVKENCSSAICVDTGYTVDLWKTEVPWKMSDMSLCCRNIKTVEKMIGPLMEEMQD